MPKVMLSQKEGGPLIFYIAKKDLEETVVEMEFDGSEQQWGGALTLSDGSRYGIEVFPTKPHLPMTVRAKRLDGDDED